MVMGSQDLQQGSSKSRGSKHQPRGRSSSVVGGGALVVGIATVVVVGVAGKLLSKLRKPNGSASSNSSYVTPTNSIDTFIHEADSDLPIDVKDGTGPPNEAVINGKSDNALDLQTGGSYHNDMSTTSSEVDHMDSARSDLDTESLPQNVIGSKSLPDELNPDDYEFLVHKDNNEGEDFSTASTVDLSKLVNQALLDNPSKHELLSKTNTALQDGIAGVISRAFEDFSCGDTSSDELTPTKLKLRVSWETNSSSGSEEEVAPVHPGELIAANELLLLGSTKADTGEHVIVARTNHNAPVGEDKEVLPESLHSSSPPFQEQEEELHATTTTGGTETEVGEPLPDKASGSVGGKESNSPKLVLEVQEDKIEPEILVGVFGLKKEIKEVASLIDEEVKKETTSQECNDVQKQVDRNELQAEVSVKVTSPPLTDTEGSPTRIAAANGVESVQILTHIAEREGRTVAVASLMLPATSHDNTNITKIVAAKESTIAEGSRKAVVFTDIELTSNTGGGLKRELERSSRGNLFSLEMLGLTLIVALIAILIWSIRARCNSSVPNL